MEYFSFLFRIRQEMDQYLKLRTDTRAKTARLLLFILRPIPSFMRQALSQVRKDLIQLLIHKKLKLITGMNAVMISMNDE